MSEDGNTRGRSDGARALARQRQRLARWLAEWQLEHALPAPEAIDAGHAATPSDPGAADTGAGALWLDVTGEEAPVVGQVRLIAPGAGAAAAGYPLFIALLAAEGGERILAAPFGRFATPALPGEWLTGRRRSPLRVLCLWNARQLSMRSAAQSWVVDTLKPRELSQALAVWAHVTRAAPLPEALARDLGPPLVHPDDPRQVYRFREISRMDRVVRELEAQYQSGNRYTDLLRAAEPPPDEEPPQPPPPPAPG